jgi:DNA-binding FadR family transcriptional regulator
MLRHPLRAYILSSLHVPQSAEVAQQQHAAILRAIEARDANLARQEMRSHLVTFARGYAILTRISETEKPTETEAQAVFAGSQESRP